MVGQMYFLTVKKNLLLFQNGKTHNLKIGNIIKSCAWSLVAFQSGLKEAEDKVDACQNDLSTNEYSLSEQLAGQLFQQYGKNPEMMSVGEMYVRSQASLPF